MRATVQETDWDSDNLPWEITVITVASESFVGVLKVLSTLLASS